MGNEGANASAPGIEWLATTSGAVSGWMGVVTGVVTAVVAAIAGGPIWIPLGLAIALVCWMVLLRPRVGLTSDDLVLRGILGTVRIPLLTITSVVIRQLVVVTVGERRFTNASIGRPLREVRVKPGQEPKANPAVDHLEELIRLRITDAKRDAATRAKRGAAPTGSTEIRSERAWPELAVGAALALAALIIALV